MGLGPVEIAVVAAVGFLLYKVVCKGGSCAPGVVAKTLGVAAVVAGIGVLATKNADQHAESVVHVDQVDVSDPEFSDSFHRGDFLHGESFPAIESHQVAPHYLRLGLIVLLGSGLIILGAILIGRERTRPLALKAVTWVGIGAILFSLVHFFGDTPRVARDARVEISRGAEDGPQRAKRPSRPGRAKRPALRPERPDQQDSHAQEDVKLPPRAGEIPVEVELAKVEIAVPDHPAPAEAAAAKKPESEMSAAAEPTKSEAPTATVDKPVAPEVQTAATNSAVAPVIAMNFSAGAVRPAWVDAPAALVNGVYTLVVNSGPYVSVPECQHALDESVLAAANHYINDYLGDDHAAALVNISPAYLRKHIKRAEYAEVLQTQSVGAMHQLYARLEFDEKARADIQRSWRNAVVQDRLWYTGGGTALVLALLATFYGYLKLDLKSGAAHRGQLQLAATLVALIVVAGAMLARYAVTF